MKKIVTFVFVSCIAWMGFSQEAADKKFLAGITIGGAVDFNIPQTTTIKAKPGGDFIAGMALDWSFSKNVGLAGGIEFDFNSFKTTYNDSVYFSYNDKNILRYKDMDGKDYASFLLEERKAKSIYLSIPVMLKFQTNFMGYMRYYGKFGIRNSLLLSTRMDNQGIGYDKDGAVDNKNELKAMSSKGVMNFYKGSVGLAGGVEYNVSGTTTIVGEIGYYYGFTEIFQQKGAVFGDEEKAMSLYNYNKKGEREYYAPSLKQGQLIFKIAVLF
ncbi:MAG: hypothetical protein H3C31_09485 [Brumimicrobium sp.]|nr:hypothetical protein [Brumimicrobium sp.]MCO5269199.1 PorT family protein [Brumimicrobium sp.]